jgi:hypothetical protein
VASATSIAMIIYYEHLKDPASPSVILGTHVLCASFQGRVGLSFKNMTDRDKAFWDFIRMCLKTPPLAKRMYNEKTHVWSYLDYTGITLLNNLKTLVSQREQLFGRHTFLEVRALEEQVQNGTISASYIPFAERKQRASDFKVEDFYYKEASPASSSAPSGDALASQLSALLEIDKALLSTAEASTLKRHYHTAALRLHPDRNNGDSSRMTELNYLWQLWNAAPAIR